MEVKLLISDIDGTLLNEKKELTDYTKKALHNFKENGGQIVLATGRAHVSAKKILDKIGIEGIIISYNGARIIDTRTNETLYHNPIEEEITNKLIEYYKKSNTHLNLYIGDNWYIEDKKTEKSIFYTNLSKIEPKEEDFNNLKNFKVTKALFFDDYEKLKVIEAELKKEIGDLVDFTYSSSYFLEVLAKGVNKGAAVEKIVEILNVPIDKCVAFGDELNDYEMLKSVKYGVAMGNSNEKLKSEILHRTLSNRENGVAKFIEEAIDDPNRGCVEKLMMECRSKRAFESEIIPTEILEEIVNVARYAGSSRNSQCARYIIINSKNILEEIFPFVKWAGAIEWNPEITEGPSAYIMLCTRENLNISDAMLNFDLGLAAQNIALKIKSLGYDMCVIGSYNKHEVNKITQLEDGYKSHYLIAVGKGKERVTIVPGEEERLAYYRVDGEHFVPKLPLEKIIIKKI
ncbi:MAG: Cof-type HAD-IIB family hydrolase [Fusobacteriaceae bacterium]|nr:Cof-type HAD-IIB family hydrolase [Fusobacteriaceae bacterium]